MTVTEFNTVLYFGRKSFLRAVCFIGFHHKDSKQTKCNANALTVKFDTNSMIEDEVGKICIQTMEHSFGGGSMSCSGRGLVLPGSFQMTFSNIPSPGKPEEKLSL